MMMFRGSCAALAIASAVLVLDVGEAHAQSAGEDKVDRAREIERLQREVDALRAVLAQMLEIERMRVEVLSQALRNANGSGGSGAVGTTSNTASSVAAATTVSTAVGGARTTPVREEPPRTAPSLDAKPQKRIPSQAGVVSGKVTLPEGVRVAYVFVENVRGSLLKNKKVAITQRNKQFVPEWAVVQVGTTVEFPNDDEIHHNVFSLSPAATFDLGLYRRGDQTKEYRFITPGVIDIYCNIHPRMVASVLVVPNELVARVRDDGTFEIPGVPEGKRKIVAWAPGAELGSDWVDVGSGSETHVQLALKPKSSAHKNKMGQSYGSYD